MSFSTKIFEMFRNLKSDAVPKAPRPKQGNKHWDKIKIEDVTDEDLYDEENYNCSFEEPEDIDADIKYPKDKQNYKKSKQKDNTHKENRNRVGNHVNTDAGGNVINIVDCVGLHWGNVTVNNFGSDRKQQEKGNDDEPKIKKTPEIISVLAAKIKLEHTYMSFISQNLGKEWPRFFRRLGYLQGQIDTFEYDEIKNGVAEVRYKILLDWVRNEEDASLGRIATHLWEDGWRDVVQGLAALYQKNRKG